MNIKEKRSILHIMFMVSSQGAARAKHPIRPNEFHYMKYFGGNQSAADRRDKVHAQRAKAVSESLIFFLTPGSKLSGSTAL